MDIAEWLRGLGLGQYEDRFRDNRIDADVLPNLTVDDLREIGVAAVGDRRKLLAAIATLTPRSRGAYSQTPLANAQPDPLEVSAERRPVAVMFCDLVGSTSLAANLDAEDWRNLVNTYLDEASEAVTGLGGHVLKKLGDGLMALFGYPQAQENDAERAVRAALGIQRSITEINARNAQAGAPELAARIGLESGPVIVDSTGEVFGEAPNIAARVQAAADPGTVLVTSTVQRQVAGLFIVEDKGPHELKGVTAPMTLYRILRTSGGRRRIGARVLTPFVGREEDLVVLARRWERVRAGEGQFVVIGGEPGIGKSRLVEEFRARLGETPHTWAEFSSSQLLQNTPLHPIAQWGRVRFGGPEVAPERRLAELESVLAQVKLDPAEYAPLIAPLAAIPVPLERQPNLPADEIHRKQLAAMVSWIIAGARVQPLVLVFDDLQWADPSSIDLVQALSAVGKEAPLLILATARPEFRPPWSVRSHHSVISLTPLDTTQVGRMVAEIASRQALSPDVVKSLSERAGGVPLFVEEVTRLLLERGEQGGVQAIPPTLRQSLAARLDRLGTAREIAQIGAVLGRSFSYTLLSNVTSHMTDGVDIPAGRGGVGYEGRTDALLRSALDRLLDSDLLFVEGAPPESVYRFKHALIQDAAYDSLLKSRRQALHGCAGEILRDQPERTGAEPEIIAHHFTEAGLDNLAIDWWGKAGDQALRRSAFQEAIAHLGKAIEMADKRGEPARQKLDAVTLALPSERLKLQADYARAVMWSKGYGADETKAAFALLAELSAGAENTAERFAAYYAQWTRNFVRAEHRQAQMTAETFLREAEKSGYTTEASVAHRLFGLTYLFQGNFQDARSSLERALSDCVRERDEETRFRFALDTEVGATVSLALTAWHLGQSARARQLVERALRRTANLDHAATSATAYLYAMFLEVFRGDPAAAFRLGEKLLAVVREHEMQFYVVLGEMMGCWAQARLLDPTAGASGFRQALTAYVDAGNKAGVSWFHGLLAELEVATLGPESALMLIDKGLAIARETGEHWTDPYLHRLRGDILLKRNLADPTPVEEAYQRAIAISKKQGARTYELLASLSLAKFYQSTDRLVEAHAVLAPALEGFSPTPEMSEIAEAVALLERLAQGVEGEVVVGAADI
jgi:predicted ATPase/class 3 adenylate cyclase